MSVTTGTTGSLTPGVYREDVRPTAAQAFLTGVPAFLGSLGDNPLGVRRFTVWPEFEATFAGAGRLADSVLGFFANGGQVCHVVGLDPALEPTSALETGLAALEALDEIDLVCLPDLIAGPSWSSAASLDEVVAAQRTVLDHCAGRGDRFALLDAVPALDHRIVLEQRRRLAGPAASFGALYHPWLGVPDGGSTRFLPSSGHVAGMVAAGDLATGVHKVPANHPIAGVVDLQTRLTDTELGELNETGVNCSRVLPGRGIRVWGARTLASEPEWRNLGARRVVITIGRWLERFMVPLTQEPNDIRLWVRVMREVTAYLEGLHRAGALKGATAEAAFYVKCDHETNPPEVVDAGMVVTQVGVALSAPAEFIVVRVVQDANTVTVNAV